MRSNNTYFHRIQLIILLISVMTFTTDLRAKPIECSECNECMFNLAIKSNLLHDALLTPDLGLELSITRHISISAEGVWAWWSRNSSHRYWRIYGGWCELRYWFGKTNSQHILTGHHTGIYGSMLSYDFEFGNKGWQSPDATYGVGVSYGYSFRLSRHMNLDISTRIGYSVGDIIKYYPQCGEYVASSIKNNRYFGPTSLEVTLVWFPGIGSKKRSAY